MDVSSIQQMNDGEGDAQKRPRENFVPQKLRHRDLKKARELVTVLVESGPQEMWQCRQEQAGTSGQGCGNTRGQGILSGPLPTPVVSGTQSTHNYKVVSQGSQTSKGPMSRKRGCPLCIEGTASPQDSLETLRRLWLPSADRWWLGGKRQNKGIDVFWHIQLNCSSSHRPLTSLCRTCKFLCP